MATASLEGPRPQQVGVQQAWGSPDVEAQTAESGHNSHHHHHHHDGHHHHHHHHHQNQPQSQQLAEAQHEVGDQNAPEREYSMATHVCFGLLKFAAYWFGNDQFDYDGDGTFDEDDVATLLFGNKQRPPLQQKQAQLQTQRSIVRSASGSLQRTSSGKVLRKESSGNKLSSPRTPRSTLEDRHPVLKGCKWNPNADCDGSQAAWRAVEYVETDRLSQEEAQTQVMLEYPAVFRSSGGPPKGLRSAGDAGEEDFVEDLLDAEVEGGVSAESKMFANKPIFIPLWSFVAFILWLATASGECSGGDGGPNGFCYNGWFDAKAGLDALSPRKTDLRITSFSDCADYRGEIVWRFLTYQFSHVGLSHVCMNVFLNLFVGIPLNGFHGNLRMILMFNIGVFGGACAWATSDVHNVTVGMSGGCWALIGMSLADLIMNWSQKKYRKPHFFLLLFLGCVETMNYYLGHGDGPRPSNAAHFGGFVAGLCCGVVVGKNLMMKQQEKYFMVIATVVGVVLLVFSLIWVLAQWPARNIFDGDEDPWCWIRQVAHPDIFGDLNYHCIRCGQQECIDAWSAMEYVSEAGRHTCEQQGGGFVYTDQWDVLNKLTTTQLRLPADAYLGVVTVVTTTPVA